MSKLLIDARSGSGEVVAGWSALTLYGHDQLTLEPTKESVHKAAMQHVDRLPAILNIEHWPLPQSMGKYIQVVDWFRESRPDVRIGYYSMIPVREYWAPIQEYYKTEHAEPQMAWWKQQNAALARGRGSDGRFTGRGLVDVVDFVCPSLYTFYENSTAWDHNKLWREAYAPANIKAASDYQKQVYPFLWPRYHNERMEYIGDDFLRQQIDLCLTLADGCVVWDYAGFPNASEILDQTSAVMKEFA